MCIINIIISFSSVKHLKQRIYIHSSGCGRRREHQEGRLEGEARQHAGRHQGGEEDSPTLSQKGH